MRPIRGWLERQEAAKAALITRGEGAHRIADDPVNAARREMIEAKEAADRAYAAEVERKRAITVVGCPCCEGKGHVLLNRAAAMVEALARYDFVGWKPDPATIGKLLPLAFDVDADGQPITETPASVPETTEPKKAKGRHVVPPHLSAE
jgi:hypothetical protein